MTNRDLSVNVLQNLRSRLHNSAVLSDLQAMLLRSVGSQTAETRHRLEVLNLTSEDGLERWQVLMNTPELFEIINSEFSRTPKGDHFCTIQYLEKGTDLPVSRTTDELRDVK